MTKARIGIVDDNLLLLKMTERALSDYDVCLIKDPRYAIQSFVKYRPDLIILDYYMPFLNGLTLCEQMKQHHLLNNIPILFLTSNKNPQEIAQCFEKGAMDIVAKPFVPVELQARIKNHLLLAHRTNQLAFERDQLKAAHTQLKELQGRIVQTEKLASLGTLAAGIAHELNNPLMVITGLTTLVRKWFKSQGGTRKVISQLDKIDIASSRIKNIVYHMVDFAREGQLGENKLLDIHEPVENALRLLQYRLNSAGILVERRFDVASSVKIEGNSTHLESIFQNLLINSIDAFQEVEPGRKKRITIATRLQADNELSILYADNASGMDKMKTQHVFDPFYTTKAPGSGTGLGMAIAYNVVSSHGGSINVESQAGKGTIFHILFPSTIEMLKVVPVGNTPRREPFDLDKLGLYAKTVLIIDDEKAVVEVLTDFISDYFRVESRICSERAIKQIQLKKYDVILTDMKMPVKSGLDVIRAVKQFQPTTPVVVVSGSPSTDKKVRYAIAEGASEVLQKPVSQEQLLEVIVNQLQLEFKKIA